MLVSATDESLVEMLVTGDSDDELPLSPELLPSSSGDDDDAAPGRFWLISWTTSPSRCAMRSFVFRSAFFRLSGGGKY